MTNPNPAAYTDSHDKREPDQVDADGTRHWYTRAANFLVVVTQAQPGACLSRSPSHQDDEYMVLLPEAVGAEIAAGAQTVVSDGDTLTIVPPGSSQVVLPAGGWVYRVFSKQAVDLLAHASNAPAYAHGAPGVADLVNWPMPVGGWQLRHYKLSDHVRSDTTMRLFRTRNLMVNVFLPNKAPRDIRKMTPHAHVDFEQGSLAISGAYVHHMRYPWSVDMNLWREDEHTAVGSPSLIVIPPKVIHTSQSIGVSGMRLVDIFSPPREDFSLKPGLVCNGDEYPLPENLVGAEPPAQLA